MVILSIVWTHPKQNLAMMDVPGSALDEDHMKTELASSCQSSAVTTPQHSSSVWIRFQAAKRRESL